MADQKNDRWLNVFCPENACLAEEERFTAPEFEEEARQSKWLELFCPENSCEITSFTQLP
jgi:hypothetical protein